MEPCDWKGALHHPAMISHSNLTASGLVFTLALLSSASAATVAPHVRAAVQQDVATVSNEETSITLLFQNNLNVTDDANHVGALLLDPMTREDATAACSALGEKLLSQQILVAYESDFAHQLAYQSYRRAAHGHGHKRYRAEVPSSNKYMVDGGIASATVDGMSIEIKTSAEASGEKLAALCSQSSNGNVPSASSASGTNKITVASEGNSYVGFRNQKSFRFLGIPYANPPKRFEYTGLYSKRGEIIDATGYGSVCAQYSSGSEDCLFLNIQTPYIPKKGDKGSLRPVHFFIHGGGFTGGQGSDAVFDGGQLASREDIVTVTPNYRLSTLGFLAVPGTDVEGNYGIADQIVALDWVIKNIANFGGDPKQITINGGSAGAGSVRALLGSPKAIGKFQGAIAMSNLGGGVNLGLDGNYATTYSAYLTPEEGMKRYGNLFEEAKCGADAYPTVSAQIGCLKKVDAATLLNLPTVARYVIQDGTIVNTPELPLKEPSANTAHVPVIFGITRDDGASFTTYPKQPVDSLLNGIMAAIGITEKHAQSIIDSGLFPMVDSGNVTLDAFTVSARVGTDNQFRCIDQATVYAGATSGAFEKAYYYQLDRTDGGYDPNSLGGAPASAKYPKGDPKLPYFRLHGGDPAWMFGFMGNMRDEGDLYSMQYSVDALSAFIRTGDPNPSPEMLDLLGHVKTKEIVKETGRWEPVTGKRGPIRVLDYPGTNAEFVDVEQCKWLGYGLEYYV
jgi:carboxylesterase type B